MRSFSVSRYILPVSVVKYNLPCYISKSFNLVSEVCTGVKIGFELICIISPFLLNKKNREVENKLYFPKWIYFSQFLLSFQEKSLMLFNQAFLDKLEATPF
jgi:hypothetical protein